MCFFRSRFVIFLLLCRAVYSTTARQARLHARDHSSSNASEYEWRHSPCKAPDEDGFHYLSSFNCWAREPWHLDLDASQHDTEFRASARELCHLCAVNDALAGQASVNPTRFSSSAICLLRARCLMANCSAVRV